MIWDFIMAILTLYVLFTLIAAALALILYLPRHLFFRRLQCQADAARNRTNG